MKNIMAGLIMLIILLISGCELAVEPGPKLGALATLPGGTFDATFPVNAKVFRPVWGTIDCFPTNQPSAWSSGLTMATKQSTTSGGFTETYYETQVTCYDYAGPDGCSVDVYNYDCDIYAAPNAVLSYRWGTSGSWQEFYGVLPMQPSTKTLQVTCRGKANQYAVEYSYPSDITPKRRYRTENIPALRVESYGWTKAGWIDGSWNCKLVTAQKEELNEMQNKNNPITGLTMIDGIERIMPGQTKNIIVGYEEMPAFGNVNPLGVQYGGKDVSCSYNTGIYEVLPVTTYGGVTYYKQGQLLSSFAERELCCLDGHCASGSYCEDYECTTKPATCEFGQCNPNTYTEDRYQSEENGRFYLVSKTCGSDSCVKIEKTEIKCTDNYCDRQCPAGQECYCDPQVGCKTMSILQPCGNGYCCKEGGEFTVQNCAYGMECCLITPLRGECKDVCDSINVEIDCGDGIDNDEDGLTDDDDPDCKVCVYETEGKKVSVGGVTPKVCCEMYKGGTFVEKQSEPPIWRFWQDTTTSSYCKVSKTIWWALIVLIIGFVANAGILWLGPYALAFSVPMMLIGGIVYLMGLMGMI